MSAITIFRFDFSDCPLNYLCVWSCVIGIAPSDGVLYLIAKALSQ